MRKTIYDPAYICMLRELRHRRRELGLRQEDVALQLGVSRTWVGKAEQCERRLDVLELHRLCLVYGISLADMAPLLNGEEEGGSDGAESS